jgi:hypothetical protein
MCDNFALVRGCSGTSNAEGKKKTTPIKPVGFGKPGKPPVGKKLAAVPQTIRKG